MEAEPYQNVIVGSGEAGKSLAWTLGAAGQKTIIVERTQVGGACPNVACLPSKNVVYSAKMAALARRSAEFGLGNANVTVDMAAVFHRKRAMVDGLQQVHLKKFAASGVEVLMGEARFVAPKTLRVALKAGGERTLLGERVFLATGSRASLPDVPGLVEARPMTHVEALDLDRLPAHLVVLGGGYIGLEFAQAFRRFGSAVTVVHRGDRLLEQDDPDVSAALLQLMKAEGVRVLFGTHLRHVTGQSGQGIQLHTQSADGNAVIDATDLLVATGRTPNTDRLDAAIGGVRLDAQGHIRVDETLRTTAPGVWAMGDCAGSPHFTHVSYDDYRIVRDNFAGGARTNRGRLIPYVLFTDPELAHVGLTEAQATARGIPYRLAKIPMAAVLRTWTLSEKQGFLKALVGDDDRVLGFTGFGVDAGETMAVVQTAMLGDLPYTTLRDAVFTHPTLAEGLGPLFTTVPPRPA